MGVLTDYFIARDDADAARAHKSTGGPKGLGFETAEWKSIDPVVTLATLDEVVTGRDALEWIRSGAPDSRIAGSDGDEHWVFRVYDHHRAVLESIRDDQIKDVARRWGATGKPPTGNPRMLRRFSGTSYGFLGSRVRRAGPLLLGLALTR